MSHKPSATREVHIRPATPEDIPALMQLSEHSRAAARWSRDRYEQLFAADSSRRVAIVVQDSEGLQGFLIAHEILDEWEIENVVIAVPGRRQGLGTRLLKEFLDHARAKGARSVFLEVRESNHAARALYQKWSFEESGRRPRYYSEPVEDALIYRRAFA